MVSLAVVGVAVGSEKAQWVDNAYVLIGVSYAVFAAANLTGVFYSQQELQRYGDAVNSAAAASGPLGRQLHIRAMKPWMVAAFHIAAALIVLAALCMASVAKPADRGGCKAAAVSRPGVFPGDAP